MQFSPPADLFGEEGLIVLIVIAVVLFGSPQIPKLARSLGSAQKEFKKGLDEGGQRRPEGRRHPVVAPPRPSPPAPAPHAPAADGPGTGTP